MRIARIGCEYQINAKLKKIVIFVSKKVVVNAAIVAAVCTNNEQINCPGV